MNQKTRILNKLHEVEWVSLADALNMNPPCYRLSERIRELEKAGYDIEHGKVAGKPYARYRLKEKDPIIGYDITEKVITKAYGRRKDGVIYVSQVKQESLL